MIYYKTLSVRYFNFRKYYFSIYAKYYDLTLILPKDMSGINVDRFSLANKCAHIVDCAKWIDMRTFLQCSDGRPEIESIYSEVKEGTLLSKRDKDFRKFHNEKQNNFYKKDII